jgi:replicative DNA helicase
MSALIYDSEAEAIVLGSLFGPGASKAHIAECVELLDESDFDPDKHRVIYRAIRQAFLAGEPLDAPLTVLHRLRRNGDETVSGGGLELHHLLEMAPSEASARHHIRTIKWASRLRDWAKLQQAELSDEAELEHVTLIAQELLHDLRGGSVKLPTLLQAEVAGAFDLFEKNAGQQLGLRSGLSSLDRVTGGFMPGQFIVVGAKTSVGKTSLLVQVAVAAAKQNARVLFLSLEMLRDQVAQRAIGQEADVPIQKMTNPSLLDEKAWMQLVAAQSVLPGGMWISDGAFRIDDLIAKIRRVHAHVGGLNMVVVDYIQLVQGTSQGNRTQEVGEVSRALKAIANELGVCVLTASQLSRQHEYDKRPPTLKDLRESGSLEHDADIVILLDQRDDSLTSNRPTNLAVKKNRNGATGYVEVNFNAPVNRFEETV